MSNKLKIEILKKMKDILQREVCIGFCKAYEIATGITGENTMIIVSEDIEKSLNELGLYRPYDNLFSCFWYRTYDLQIRLDKIDEAITKWENE